MPRDFNEHLNLSAGRVETRLRQLLAELAGAQRASPRLADAMTHAVLGGGKRFRPFLVIETAGLFGVAPEAAIDTAAALECVHCYSLAHDDLPSMDNDELRRGLPTVWRAFDEWTAILAGDGLLTLAFEILARPQTHMSAAVRVALISALAEAAGPAGMVGGQALDLAAERLSDRDAPTLEGVRRLQAMKTGALIRFACEAGAILGETSEEDRTRLARFGEALGFAFQIADDLLDVEGTADEVGKAVAKDAQAGKATTVSLMGIDDAKSQLLALEREAVSLLEPFGERAARLNQAARFVVSRRS